MTSTELVIALRAVADFYESHPELKVPATVNNLNIFTHSREEFASQARIFGSAEKAVCYDFYELRKRFGPINLILNAYRYDVCERVKVGEKVVPTTVVPAREEQVIAEHVEPVYEWKCPESVLADGH